MAPSIVEQASEAPGPDELRAWLRTTAIAFDEERTLLAALVAGPDDALRVCRLCDENVCTRCPVDICLGGTGD